MSKFKPTFLYIKQHKVTGLKYFGKTHQNPEKYRGSGMYWKDHCKTHGYDIETVWYQLFIDSDTIQEVALNFSSQNNIVNSDEWANLVEENGINSGRGKWTKEQKEAAKGKPKSEEHRRKISESNTGPNNHMFGKTHTPDTKERMSTSHLGKTHSTESKEKMRGENNHFFGRTHSDETKDKISKAKTGVKTKPETLQRRIQTIKSLPEIFCDVCGRAFKYSRRLDTHKEIHIK